MRNILQPYVVIFTFLLSGCDGLIERSIESLDVNEPTIIIHSGYLINIADKSVAIQGFDDCLKEDEFKNNCIAFNQERESVPVRILFPAGSIVENWTVVRDSRKRTTGLMRPDGTFVVPANP